MQEEANKILVDLLKKASDGIDSAIAFSQAQIPDVVHQLLVWNMVDSLIKTLIAISTIPLVIWFMKKQCKKLKLVSSIMKDAYGIMDSLNTNRL